MNKKIEYKSRIIAFELIRRKRKTMGITIAPPDIVKVVAPLRVPEYLILQKVSEKAPWIIKKLDEFSAKGIISTKKVFQSGELFLYLGKSYVLQVEFNSKYKKPMVELNEDKIYIYTNLYDEDKMRNAMEKWYRGKAIEAISLRVRHFQKYFVKAPIGIVVKEQKKRWASCTGKDKLLFNWRCIMAPEEIIDYIVLHELCHMVHKNHSKDYWNLVNSLMPDYKKKQDWLKQNGVLMNL